jgi:hypothetical protein
LQNSDNSSPAKPARTTPSGAARSRFALTGRSARIDPRTDAARRDLADVRLASRVFAPHYAAPVTYVATAATPLLESRDPAAETLVQLAIGELFEVLELSAGSAWGRAPAPGLVGYVDASHLKVAA